MTTDENNASRPAPRHYDAETVRELYWQNVVSQMLSTLSVFSVEPPPETKPDDEQTIEPSEMLDGRFAVVTRTGMRIPIAEVHPLFACSINTGAPEIRQLANDVQCSVFRIRTPTGEMYTMPIQEIRGIHALTPELLQQLEEAAERQAAPRQGERKLPFGFAAFTSLARKEQNPDDPYYPAPPGFRRRRARPRLGTSSGPLELAHQHPEAPAMRCLVAIPVYNEQRHVANVLERVLEYADDVLVIDDGSTDATPMLLSQFPVEVIRHARNRGYGRSMQDAFRWARVDEFDWVVTMDCDEQHEPASIPDFLDAINRDDGDVISGSRYLSSCPERDKPPADRRAINATITEELNHRLGLELTDAFCGFKAYRVAPLLDLSLHEDGYAFPMQFWVRAVAAGLRIREIPVKLIYNDLRRSFGGPLDDADVRLEHYRQLLHCELERHADRLPAAATDGVAAGCR